VDLWILRAREADRAGEKWRAMRCERPLDVVMTVLVAVSHGLGLDLVDALRLC